MHPKHKNCGLQKRAFLSFLQKIIVKFTPKSIAGPLVNTWCEGIVPYPQQTAAPQSDTRGARWEQMGSMNYQLDIKKNRDPKHFTV